MMEDTSRWLKGVLRPLRDIVFAAVGFLYDFARFYSHSGRRPRGRAAARDFKAVKIYHRLEKSLAFRDQRPNAGQEAAYELYRHLKISLSNWRYLTFHEQVGLRVLSEFLIARDPNKSVYKPELYQFIESNADHMATPGGAIELRLSTLKEGVLDDPDRFFNSRHSVRDFSNTAVPEQIISRAVSMAMRSPSVCNRQASHVYILNSRKDIDRALLYQNGNRGFGHEVQCLLIICSDLSAFDTAGERYQHWVDGGMFSMTLIWALHALGYASCCLNWSKTPRGDIMIRREIPIRREHSIIMMLAVGVPRDNLKVCQSVRRPAEDILEILK